MIGKERDAQMKIVLIDNNCGRIQSNSLKLDIKELWNKGFVCWMTNFKALEKVVGPANVVTVRR